MPVVWPWRRHRDARRLSGSTGWTGRNGQPVTREADRPVGDGRLIDAGAPRPAGGQLHGTHLGGLRPIPVGEGSTPRPWPTDRISGRSTAGDPVEILLGDRTLTLLCFLAAHCDGCEAFWEALGDERVATLPEGVSCVVITKGDPVADRQEVTRLSKGISRCPVVMSDEAWNDFQVFGYPFFILVGGSTRTVIAETVGFGWQEVRGMVESAIRE